MLELPNCPSGSLLDSIHLGDLFLVADMSKSGCRRQERPHECQAEGCWLHPHWRSSGYSCSPQLHGYSAGTIYCPQATPGPFLKSCCLLSCPPAGFHGVISSQVQAMFILKFMTFLLSHPSCFSRPGPPVKSRTAQPAVSHVCTRLGTEPSAMPVLIN